MKISFSSDRDKLLLSIINKNLTRSFEEDASKSNGLTEFSKAQLEIFITNKRSLTPEQVESARVIGDKILNYSRS